MPALPPRVVSTAVSAAAATAVLTAVGCGQPEPAEVRGTTLRITLAEYRIAPQTARVAAGPLTVEVRNAGTMVHRLQVRSGDRTRLIAATPPLRPGETARLTVRLAPGSYVTTCPQDRHHTLGERGAIEAR